MAEIDHDQQLPLPVLGPQVLLQRLPTGLFRLAYLLQSRKEGAELVLLSEYVLQRLCLGLQER
jgi:hypothetical protein